MKIAILQHVAFETAGMIADWSEARGQNITVYKLYKNTILPSIDSFDMLVVMGGPMSVGDEIEYPWLVYEKNLIKSSIKENKYVLGICLGAQLIASVMGAKVYPNPVKEIGWFPVDIVDEAIGQPILSGLNSAMTVFHWHGDTFDLPKDAWLIMSSAVCKNQAFLYQEKVLGLQFHLEMTEESIRDIIAHCSIEIVPSATIQSKEIILASMGAIHPCKKALNSILDKFTIST